MCFGFSDCQTSISLVLKSHFLSPMTCPVIFQEQVETFLAGRVYELLSRTPIKLIIMDSIASVFRFQEVEKVTSLDRAVRLQRVAVTLRRLQSQYGVALVCSNQVQSCQIYF
jgi:RecA/RadA recombinase